MPTLRLIVDGPLDLVSTLGPLVRGQGDRTIRLGSSGAWWTTRTVAGPATLRLRRHGDGVVAEGYGPGADIALHRARGLIGIGGGWSSAASDDPAGAGHPFITGLRRRRPGVRVTRTRAVLDSLLPAILEQKVTGVEARRAWNGLVRVYGEPAPDPAGLGLRLTPEPATLARLPYHAYHPFGIERRRADLIRHIAARSAWFEAIADLALHDAYGRLRSIPGIGPWTAAEVAVRALGDRDAVSVGDFHTPSLVAWTLAGEHRADDARMLELLEPWRGERALVIRLIESSGRMPPRHGPRLTPRRIEGI